MLHDKDIREPLFDYLDETFGKTRVMEEKMMGRSRADVIMVIEDAVVGIEIKSDADTYTRLKSLRAGKVNLKDSYCQVKDGEIFLIGVHISPYENGNRFNLDPMRMRKLLMHKKEIIRLFSKTKEDGLTLVPTKCYFKDSKVKFEIGLARGKKNFDKRDTEAAKQAKRDIERAVKNRNNL